jgi:hypothetical protein
VQSFRGGYSLRPQKLDLSTIFNDGKVELSIVTHWTNDQTLQEFYKDEIASRTEGKDYINYSVIKDSWYVISGTNSLGFEFYTKRCVFGNKGNPRYVDFDFVYPTSQRSVYDAVVIKIAHEFIPDLPG